MSLVGSKATPRDIEETLHPRSWWCHAYSKVAAKRVARAVTVEEESDYSPYGTEFVGASGPNHYKFTGEERDTETQLDYFGATRSRDTQVLLSNAVQNL
jgi:hypothetical protein